MEIDCVNNKQLLEPINFKSESIFSKNDLQITIDNSKNIVSLNQNREEPKKFKTLFWSRRFSFFLSIVIMFL